MTAALARLRASWAALPANLRGATWIVCAALALATLGACVKLLGARLDTFQIAFFRCLFGLVALIPFILRHGGARVLATRRKGVHLLRAGIGVGAMLASIYAVTHMPLADAVTLSFTQPLFIIPLAALVIGERIRPARWIASGCGFLGVVIMVGPGGAAYGLAALIGVGGAFLVACVRIMVKELSATERPLTILVWFATFSTLLTFGPALAVWRAPSAGEYALLILVGALASGAQTLIIWGLRTGEVSAVAPFEYSRLLFAAGFGYALFAQLPGPATLAGAAVIVAASAFLGRSEMAAR
jgi:drug/metabolite transporter (DMT)-like permease